MYFYFLLLSCGEAVKVFEALFCSLYDCLLMK